MATLVELLKSRKGTFGHKNQRTELECLVLGTDDDDLAHLTVEAGIPEAVTQVFKGVVHVLLFQNYDFEYQGGKVYTVTVYYAKPEPQGQDDGDGPKSEYTFDTSGGSTKITHGKTISKTTWSGGTIQENHGGINVTENGAEGVDWPVAQFNWTETHYFPDHLVTDAFKIKLRNLTGKVNLLEFRGNAKGEVRFMGARGSKRGREQWQITFLFEGSPNLTDIVLSQGTTHEIIVPEKEGFHYLWIRTDKVEDGSAMCMAAAPSTAYVSQVRPDNEFYADLNSIGI